MDWTNDDQEGEPAARLLAFDIVPPESLSGVVRLRCGGGDGRENVDISIRLNPSQARDLAQELLKLALDAEATLFDTP